MPKLVKVYSADELERQVHFFVREHQSPGLLKFLASLPFGTEGAWWRGVGMLWLQQHAEAPDFQQRVAEALAASGIEAGVPTPRKRRAPVARLPKMPTAVTQRASQALPPVPPVPAQATSRAERVSHEQIPVAVVSTESTQPVAPAQPASDELDDRAIALLDQFGSMAD